ncbi:MAG: hypothetical protein ACREDR_32525 [Blastocatellia bacterium]
MKAFGVTSIRLATFASSLVFVIWFAAPTLAQSNSKPPMDPNEELRNQNNREMEVRALELSRDPADPNAPPKVTEAAINQVKDDFAQLQAINAQVMREYGSGEAPDYKKLLDEMKDINKRARRLNSSLMLPAEGAEKAKIREASPLLALSEVITRFVTNPLFKESNTVNSKLAAKAKGDLLTIIDLSNRLSKSSEKLSKSGAPAKKD